MKYIKGTLRLEDIEACQKILEGLQAPTDEENVKRLQLVITTLGQVVDKAYEDMMRKIAKKQLAMFHTQCDCCGAEYSIHLSVGDLSATPADVCH